jgi:hypothetical protein
MHVLQVYDLASSKLLGKCEGHHKPVRSLVFTPGTHDSRTGAPLPVQAAERTADNITRTQPIRWARDGVLRGSVGAALLLT